ncbi:MAG: homocysteine S-methyltransferase family protein [Phycisphaerales bacterium]|nr:homocysteine S-methyltransferase family protein [Phycisphaerales bacterium]
MTDPVVFDPADYRNEIVLGGGDWAVELSARGVLQTGLWERTYVDQPDIVREISSAFLDAGAAVLVTNTDRVNDVALAKSLESGDIAPEDISAINRAASAAFRSAADGFSGPTPSVFGTIGPVEPLMTLNEIKESVLLAAYRTQSEALAAGGADAIVCRSFTELEALLVAVQGAKEGSGLPVVGSMTFDCGPEYTETTMGVTVPQACQALTKAGVSMVGCDRGEYPDGTVSIVTLFRASCDLPIWVEINAGQAELEEERSVYAETPKAYSERFKPIAEAGATMIIGGYGASVEHIVEMARVRERYLKKAKHRKSS